jgi:hypothetical protein
MAEAEGASSVKIQNFPSGSKAVLRIKRKRSADPADILCKYVFGIILALGTTNYRVYFAYKRTCLFNYVQYYFKDNERILVST